MKHYRGYYIDNVVFHTEADIDEYIKARNIRRYQQHIRLMNHYTERGMIIAAHKAAYEIANFLVKECGLTWADIEEIELSA